MSNSLNEKNIALTIAERIVIQSSQSIIERQFYRPGVSAIVAKSKAQPTNGNPYTNKVPQGQLRDAGLYKSLLGTPVMGNLDITGGNFTDNNNVSQTYPSLQIDTVLFVVDQTKNIVKTAINGLPGTVKEYISGGDSVITIEGVIVGANGIYPFDEVAALTKVLDAPVSLKINSYFLQNLGINNMVVTSYSFPQSKGSYSYQPFKISALSDFPVELFIVQ